MVESGDVRVGDADRQAAIDALRRHTGEGRLTLDEFSDRAGRAYAARTRRDLDQVLEGLPDGIAPSAEPEVNGSGPPPGDRPAERRRFIAVMCGTTARGRWRAPRRVTGVAFWGGAKVDLRNAVFEEPVVDIYAWAIMGSVSVVVPEGIPVELDGMVLMGGASNRARTTDPRPGAPLVRVHARGLWGGVDVRTGRPRSTRGSLGDLVDRNLDDVRDKVRAAVRSLPPPPPPPPPPPFAKRHAHARRRRSVGPPGPGPWVGPPDLRDLLPRFLTEDPPPASRPGENGLPKGTLTILVTDMVGSTRLAEEVGDRRWWQILQAHNRMVRDEIERHGGTEVKAQGDGFLVVFPSARQAILAAVAMQEAAARRRREDGSHPVELRIGLHTGETVEADGDVFGQNVIVAVRIADAAQPGDILVSGLTRDLTAAAGDLRFDPGEDVDLKGFSRPWRVHRVMWG
ncbi:MAG TPA: DUF1707 domain-containing protein [Acidimicrobiales bacterium]|nr:DUF1707 domain-containing protein [Acidimicrobiales bacterium]